MPRVVRRLSIAIPADPCGLLRATNDADVDALHPNMKSLRSRP
jgi:hypothetical protein